MMATVKEYKLEFDGYKFVLHYEINNEYGRALGTTHLEAATSEALVRKVVQAHAESTAAFHRVRGKRQIKISPNPAVPDKEQKQ
jgi:hypothetical protein